MSLFTPDSPAGRAVRELLHQHKAGLSIPHIRRQLRAFRLSEANLRELLAHPDFDGPDPQGRYTLRRLRQAEQVALGKTPSRAQRGPRAAIPPTLAHPPLGAGARPAPTSYVIFDLETSGINPDTGYILQLSALKMVHGAPDPERPIFNRYVDAGDVRIPYTLQLKLDLERDAEGRLALPGAAPPRQVLANFHAWAGDLPLVAHNVRFDYNFLNTAFQKELGQTIPQERLLDTMEMACLALPSLSSFKLEDLAAYLGIRQDLPLGAEVEQLARAGGVDFGWGKFHNAVVDVLVLAVVFRELQARLREQLRPLAGWVHHLLPDLAGWLAYPDATGRGDPAPTGLPAPHTLIRLQGPGGASPSAANRSPLLAFNYSVETVRSHFQRLLESKGYPERPPQTQMVDHVTQAFRQGRFLVVEAPTGTGKTYAYLVPAILRARSLGRPVAVSTHTHNLQDQLIGDLQDLTQHLDLDFTFQPIKGMENYLCLERLGLFIEEFKASGQADDEERLGLLYLLSWLSSTQAGALDEPSYWFQATFPSFGAILREVKAEWERCDQAACPQRDGCFFRHAYQKAADADIVVVNHALLLSKKWESTGLHFEYLVVDEAHNLEDVATNALTREMSLDTLAYVLGRLHDPRTGRGLLVRLRRHLAGEAEGQRLLSAAFQEAARASHLAGEFGGHLLNYLKARKVKIHEKYGAKLILQADPRRATPRLWGPVEEARNAMLGSLSELHSALTRLRHTLSGHPLPAEFQAPTLRELDYLLDRLDPRQPGSEPALLADILRVGYDSRVMVNWLEVEAEGDESAADRPIFWALKSAPVRVDGFLQEHLYRMSADVGAGLPQGPAPPAPTAGAGWGGPGGACGRTCPTRRGRSCTCPASPKGTCGRTCLTRRGRSCICLTRRGRSCTCLTRRGRS